MLKQLFALFIDAFNYAGHSDLALEVLSSKVVDVGALGMLPVGAKFKLKRWSIKHVLKSGSGLPETRF